MPSGEGGVVQPRPSSPYRPVALMAEGGMGTVWLAVRQEGSFRRLYALKRPHPQFRRDESFRAMFANEARLAGLIRHPNVVSVHDVGEDDHGPFLVMDYVEGLPAARLITDLTPKDEWLPVALCVSIALHAARGLHAAHELTSATGTPLSLVHRDVSPQNVLVGFDGVTRVSDFGIAKALDNADRTAAGTLKGNLGYASPEQLRFEAPDRRSDLFSLGVVLYELLARRRLYRSDDPDETARRIREEPPPDIHEVRGDIPPDLVELLFDLLAKDRVLRPASAAAVAARLEAIAAGLASEEGPFDAAAYVTERFAAARAQQAELVARALKGEDAVVDLVIPSGEAAVTAASPGRARALRVPTPLAAPPPRRRRRLVVAITASSMVAAVAAALVVGRKAAPIAGPEGMVFGGAWHTCAVRQGGLTCWGKNSEGQLGDGTTQDRVTRTSVRGQISSVRSVGAGHWHTCAVSAGGQVSCWGRNRESQLGFRGPAARFLTPMAVPHAERATAVVAGDRHSCALYASGRVACWGNADAHQLGGLPPGPPGPREIPGISEAAGVATDKDLTCVWLRDGRVLCWGDSVGLDGTAMPRPTPTPVSPVADATGLAVGDAFGCALRRSGRVACWGDNSVGQLGDGTRTTRSEAADVAGLEGAVAVAARGTHACALRRDGRAVCWGKNQWGNLGDGGSGPTLVSTRPTEVVGLVDAVSITAGRNHTCARLASGAVSCWGHNETGQLGDATTERRTQPVSAVGFP